MRGLIHTMFHVKRAPRVGSPILAGDSVQGAAPISYVSPLLAIVVGIAHAALAPVILIGGVKPNLGLAAVVLVTTQLGFGAGVTWAFVTGLTVNLLVGEPLGSVPLGLLMVAAMVAGGQRILGAAVWVYPIAAAFAGSLVADAVSIAAAQLLLDVSTVVVPGDLVLAAATLNAAIVGLLIFPVRTLTLRFGDEAPSW